MAYLYILMAAWIVALVAVRVRNARKMAFAVAHLESIGASASILKAHMAQSKVWLIEVWASFFFGSIFGGIACLLYWAFS
jgi:hypothetical protein